MPQNVMVKNSGLVFQNVRLLGNEKAMNVVDSPGYNRRIDDDVWITKRIEIHLVPSFNAIIRKSC